MLPTESPFIGVDLSASRKSISYAVLDRNLNLVALADCKMDDLITFLAGQTTATVAVNAPSNVNRGIVHANKKNIKLAQVQFRRADMRLAEYELREHGIHATKTPANLQLCPAWMRSGFELFRKLEKMNFAKYPETDSACQIMEANPQASFSILAGQTPLARSSLEGRLQRHLLLHEHGVRIKDPMDFFEEVTRYKIIKGLWPMELLYTPDQLDALAAAYTAWYAVNKAGSVVIVGDAKEGKIVLPDKELNEKY